MAGFALSTDEISSVCRNLAAQLAEVPDRIEEIKASEIGIGDFGGSRYADLVQRYVEATQDVIPRLLTEYAGQGRALAQRIEQTLQSYTETDGAAAESLAGKAP